MQETELATRLIQPIPRHAGLLRELVAHLRQLRTQLREEWARRITESGFLTAMSRGNLRRGDVGLRQLRRRARNSVVSRPWKLRPRPFRADHSPA